MPQKRLGVPATAASWKSQGKNMFILFFSALTLLYFIPVLFDSSMASSIISYYSILLYLTAVREEQKRKDGVMCDKGIEGDLNPCCGFYLTPMG